VHEINLLRMMLLEISPLILMLWVAFRLENLRGRLVKVEKKLGIPAEEVIAKEELIKEIVRVSSIPKMDNPTKF